MKYGMNLLLWSPELNESVLPVLPKLKEFGFDGVEIPMFNLDIDYAAWAPRLDDLGFERTAVTVRTLEDNPISSDPAVRQRGVDANKRTIDCCQAIGVKTLCGPFHSALGEFNDAGRTEDEWKWGIESIREVAHHAADAGVTLAVEPLNRFEVYFLNSVEEAARFASEVDHPNCKILVDTFHAHMEEKSTASALLQHVGSVGLIHISENDRSTPGKGQVHWDSVFDAICKSEYDGWLTIEAFGTSMPEIAVTTRIWRRMYDTEFGLASDGLTFMKREVERRRGE